MPPAKFLEGRDALLRLKQIVGDPKADPPIPAIIPVSKSTWWAGVASGLFPRPIKLGPRTTAWRASDISRLIDRSSTIASPQWARDLPEHSPDTRAESGRRAPAK